MTASQHRVSLGAVAMLLCLALPAGLLSLFAESTTGEQVDRADLVIAGRVASLQDIVDSPAAGSEVTAVEFAVSDVLWGSTHAAHLTVSVEGRPPLQVGDTVVALVARHPAGLLGALQLRKNSRSLAWEIHSPVTGMLAQGLGTGGPDGAIPLALFEDAVRLRKGLAPRAGGGSGGSAAASEGSLDPDAYEPNDTLATAAHLTGLHPPSLLTGNPLLVTGLTLVPSSDVDFFSFDAPSLTILHAETKGVTGLLEPDTLMGLFNTPAGDLLAWDDDDGEGSFSKLTTPIETGGLYAVAIESAPDSNLDFVGDEGVTTGFYELALELELGSYLWNQLDLIFGMSPDGTFIEDFIGFKEIGGQDVFLVDVPADGWAVDLDVGGPSGVTHVYGGGGDQLTDPAFANPLLPVAFQLGSYEDFAGFNRRGFAHAISMVTYTQPGEDPRGLLADYEYQVSVGDSTVVGRLVLKPVTHAPITNLSYARVSDVNLFGQGADQFFWSFNPQSPLQAFAVDGLTNVGNVVAPAMPFGNATGDLQTAVTIDAGSLQAPQVYEVGTGFTYVKGFPTSVLALNEAVRRLRQVGIDTWVVAVDADPATGLFAAFGTGLGAP